MQEDQIIDNRDTEPIHLLRVVSAGTPARCLRPSPGVPEPFLRETASDRKTNVIGEGLVCETVSLLKI